MMKIALVVQRYGAEVIGGSESLCRQVAEYLNSRCELEVITSCAADFLSWKNEFSAGEETINGVVVRRFRCDFPRTVHLFNFLWNPELIAAVDEPNRDMFWERFLLELGPNSSEMRRFISLNRNAYDAFFFFTYEYATTAALLPLVKNKAFLIPTAHDVPYLDFPPFANAFRQARGLIFLTPEEQHLVLNRFGLQTPNRIAATGIELAAMPEATRTKLAAAYHNRLPARFVVYLGRITEGKNCPQLFDYWQTWVQENPRFADVKLCLIGDPKMPIPADERLVCLGRLPEEDKRYILSCAECLIMPSEAESLSYAILEAWAESIPVIVNGHCAVLKGQTERAGGGFSYFDRSTFCKALTNLTGSPELRDKMGQSGRRYVEENYTWDRVEESYLGFAASILAQQLPQD